jgi:hypothetical protein
MDDERPRRALGWGSMGSGLLLLSFAHRIRRLLRLPVRSGPLRAVGARDVLIGLGVVLGRHRLPWLWARSVSDALDTAWLWKKGRTALAVGGLGLTLVDLVAVRLTRGAWPRRRRPRAG